MSTEVVPLAEPYFEQLRETVDSVARERRYIALTEVPPREETFDFYRGLLRTGSPSFVALLDGQVVGWCDIQYGFGQARRRAGTLGVGLLRRARGRGLGRKLMEAAISKAWEKGMTRIELTVRIDNEVARVLYEQLGFKHEGVNRRAFFLDGQYYDSHSMALFKENLD